MSATTVETVERGSSGEALVERLAFPVVMVAAIASAIHLMNGGMHPMLAFALTQVPAFMTVIVLERIYPYHKDWNRSHGDVWVDVRHLSLITLTVAVLAPLFRLLGLAIVAWMAVTFGLGLWPNHWPLAGQLVLALVVGELGQYWVHRFQHEKDWLWRFHALHHSAPRLYWLNAARFHPVDIALNAVAANFVLIALGAGIEVIALWLLFSAIHGIFQHANLLIRIGPLNWIFSMAELHRWHHSRLVDESNTNYGQNLIIWDVVFGSRLLPNDREPPPDIGLTGLSAYPMTWAAQLMAPVHWRQIRRTSSERSVSKGVGEFESARARGGTQDVHPRAATPADEGR